nr:unnamed protein product [Callosobruchus analis]
MLIYPRNRMPTAIGKNGSIGALYKCSKNGWIASELFVECFHHFQKHVKPTHPDPVLLVLGNHHSHISIETYNFCKAKNPTTYFRSLTGFGRNSF